MKLLVTGADGFIGKNLILALRPRADVMILPITRASSPQEWEKAAGEADFIVHLAGVNRPKDGQRYDDNVEMSDRLVAALSGKKTPILYSSSIQANCTNPYGESKRAAEEALKASGADLYLYRLPNVFGKFSRPNYNSAVATFCHNIARGEPIAVNDPAASLTLVYIDDVIESFISAIEGGIAPGMVEVKPEFQTTVGEVASLIQSFRDSRASLLSERVGVGMVRALYATYVSYLPTTSFSYSVKEHSDPRGKFVEMLKTPDCGQFSFFTAHPGVTRGGHYHHTKTEKFLVISGKARFAFRHMVTDERYELTTSGDVAEIVETIPGWTHDITNVGDSELVVMLWANEIFDRNKPDTYAETV